jgi:hypothetical protein
MSIGPYLEFTLAEARDSHAAERAKVRRGADPLAEKRAAKENAPRAVPTFGEVADEFLKTHEGSWRNDKHGWQ